MRKLKIGAKMSLLFVLFALILCLAVSLFSYFTSYEAFSDFYSNKAQEAAALAAAFVDGDRIAAYLETGETDEYYEYLRHVLNDIKRTHNINFLYVFSPELDRFTYVVEASVETDDPALIASLGEEFVYTELELQYLVPDIIEKKASERKVVKYDIDQYGQVMMAWVPVFDSRGGLAAMVEADVSLKLVLEMLTQYVTRITILSCGIILVIVVLLALFNRKIVTRPLARLTRNVLNFASGDTLSYSDDIRTGDEMQTLNEAFKEMSNDIDNYTKRLFNAAAEKERIATELNVAVDIRKSFLPRPFDYDQAFGVSALIESARQVGGDFYDFFYTDERHVCVAVANVSGSGIPAALFMVVAKTVLKNQMMAGIPVDEAMALVNTRLFESNSGGMSVAAFVGVLEKDTGNFSYVNAGGETPLLLRKGGGFEWLNDKAASVLAENKNVKYRKMELAMRQGDKLFLYTGGVPALKSASQREIGKDALRELLNLDKSTDKTAAELLREVNNELLVFTDGAERASDATMLLLTYDKGSKALSEITVPSRADSFKRVLPFIKNQLYENELGGAFYAGVIIAVEELFVLAAGRLKGSESITVRCAVNGGRVEVKILYGGALENPLLAAAPAEQDVLSFIRKNTNELSYSVQEGKNVMTMVKEK